MKKALIVLCALALVACGGAPSAPPTPTRQTLDAECESAWLDILGVHPDPTSWAYGEWTREVEASREQRIVTILNTNWPPDSLAFYLVTCIDEGWTAWRTIPAVTPGPTNPTNPNQAGSQYPPGQEPWQCHTLAGCPTNTP